MPEPLARFLCTGDLHLGRYPTRLTERRNDLTVEAVWQATVEYAVSQDVDALFLTGDVVDRDNRYYEAFGPLQRGLEQLFRADIDVYAVSGNHDFDVLPRLADALQDDHFKLLGRGGEWEIATIEKSGEPIVRIAGWSFPQNQVTASPLKSFIPVADDLPLIGMLHGDLDQFNSTYAPLQRSELLNTSASVWLLGHLHRPVLHVEAGTPILYVGSLQPLDPGETGRHGPWLMELSKEGTATIDQVYLATLRYRHLSIDASSITDEASFRNVITDEITSDLKAIREEHGELRRAVYRLELSGRTAIQPELEQFGLGLRNSTLEIPVREASATIDAVAFSTVPDHDLEALSKEPGPPAVIARLLKTLEEGGSLDHYDNLLSNIRRSTMEVNRANAFQPLRAEGRTKDATEEQVRDVLHRQGMKLLDQLMKQKTQRGSHG